MGNASFFSSPSEPVINKEMNSRSQTNANNQNTESKSSSDDVTIVVYSDDSPNKDLVGKYEKMESAIKSSDIRDEAAENESDYFSKRQSSHVVNFDKGSTRSEESDDSNETFDEINKNKRKLKIGKIISTSSSDNESSKFNKHSVVVIEGNEEAKGAVERATESDDIPAPSSSRTRSSLVRRKICSFKSDGDAYNKAGNGKLSDSDIPDVVQRKRTKSTKRRLRHRHKRSSSSSGNDSDSENKIGSSSSSSSTANEAVTRKGQKSKEVEEISRKSTLLEAEEVGEEGEDADDIDGKKGRKKIRKILKDKKLSSETKNAEALERERRKRLEERQKLVR